MVLVFCSGRFVSAAMADVSVCRWDAFAQRIVIYAVVWCRTAFDRELYVLEPLSLGPHKVPYVAPANSKEHESKSHNSPPRTTCGEGLRYCWPQDKPVRRPREFSFRSRTNTNPIHRARPAGRPVRSACGFSSPSDAGQVALEPTANGSRRETSLNHRHFVDAHRYRMPLSAQGGFRGGRAR